MFHSSHPTLFGRPAGVHSETEALRSTIAGLRRVSAFPLSYTPQATIETQSLLSDFSAALSTYFDAEEASGYFGMMTAEYPGLERQVVVLQQAHVDFRDAVASLRQLARDGTETADLARRIGIVIDDFEQHEHAESDLLDDFFLREEGNE
jgi:hypothetical protein